MDDFRTIRIRARQKLSETGMNVGEFAVAHNIPMGTAYAFFSKDQRPGLMVTGMMAEALGVSMDWLCGIRLGEVDHGK